jgi:hypothetical protein
MMRFSWQRVMGRIRLEGPDVVPFRRDVAMIYGYIQVLENEHRAMRSALESIERMPTRLQRGDKLAENPNITHDLAARTLHDVGKR